MSCDPKTTRCRTCRAEFTNAELEGVICCPACQSKSAPLSIAEDTTIAINWGDLRLLGIWASNWAEKFDLNDPANADSKVGLHRMLADLQKKYRQPGWGALTLVGEIRELQDKYPTASLHDADGATIGPPREEPEAPPQ